MNLKNAVKHVGGTSLNKRKLAELDERFKENRFMTLFLCLATFALVLIFFLVVLYKEMEIAEANGEILSLENVIALLGDALVPSVITFCFSVLIQDIIFLTENTVSKSAVFIIILGSVVVGAAYVIARLFYWLPTLILCNLILPFPLVIFAVWSCPAKEAKKLT